MKLFRQYRLADDLYFPAVQQKDAVVLHFTASSSAQSVYNHWVDRSNGVKRIATAYVVGLNGAVYEFFPEASWAYHLGLSVCNTNHIQDRRTIGIEIVNVGPLRKKNGALNWWPADFGTRYCIEGERDKFVEKEFRGEKYFAAFPEEQVASVASLVKGICAAHGIPLELPPVDRLTVSDPVFFSSWRGICSHQNFRPDKFDMGPAWPWERFRALLNQPEVSGG